MASSSCSLGIAISAWDERDCGNLKKHFCFSANLDVIREIMYVLQAVTIVICRKISPAAIQEQATTKSGVTAPLLAAYQAFSIILYLKQQLVTLASAAICIVRRLHKSDEVILRVFDASVRVYHSLNHCRKYSMKWDSPHAYTIRYLNKCNQLILMESVCSIYLFITYNKNGSFRPFVKLWLVLCITFQSIDDFDQWLTFDFIRLQMEWCYIYRTNTHFGWLSTSRQQ